MTLRITLLLGVFALAGCGGDDAAPADAGGLTDAGTTDAWPPDAGPPTPVELELADCTLMGQLDQGMNSFWNIPYAAPPVGDLRWKPPEPPEACTAPRDATAEGPVCTQGSDRDDEDCLQLNVSSPDLDGALPVFVWIHGGGFALGSGTDDIYPGPTLAAAGPMVFVSINYRLGPLGYMGHPVLTTEGGGTSGNYGLLDQVEALRWVQRNIADFGGDPANVAIAGESAGGHAVCELLVAPAARGLFHRAITQSGGCTFRLNELADAELIGETLAAEVGCDGADPLTCMRALPADELIRNPFDRTDVVGGVFYHPNSLDFYPFVDGTHLPRQIDAALLAGEAAPVPVIVGSNTHEGTIFHTEVSSTHVANDTEYRDAVAVLWGDAAADAIVAEYPSSDYDSPNDAIIQVSSDGFFTCPARRTARSHAAAGNATYRYVFARLPTGTILPDLGAFHAAELLFLFGTHHPTFGRVGASGEELSDAMQGYWTRFTAIGDPNGAGAVPWPAYDGATDPYLRLDVPVEAQAGYLTAECDFWDGIYDGL